MLKIEIGKAIHRCVENGMKDSNSIYQQVIDTVPNALANRETEEYINNYLKYRGFINE